MTKCTYFGPVDTAVPPKNVANSLKGPAMPLASL